MVKGKNYDVIAEDNSGEIVGQFMVVEEESGARIEEISWPNIKLERTKEDCFVKVVYVAQSFIDGKWSPPEYKLFPYVQSGEFDHYFYMDCTEFEKKQNKLDPKVIQPLDVSEEEFFQCACTENDDRIPPDTPIWVGLFEPERPPFETGSEYLEELGKDVKIRRIIVVCFAKVENPNYK